MNEVLKNKNKLSSAKVEALIANESSYQLLVDSVKDYAIFMLNDQGFIISWNQGAQKLKGYTKDEILNKHFSIFYTKEAKDRDHPAYELKVAAKEGRFEEEGWRVKKDRTTFWANVVISAMYDSNNKLVGFAKVTRDLTERKTLEDKLLKANKELKANEERARLFISGVKDYAIFQLTTHGEIATWNEGAKRIKGYSPEEVIGKHFSMFYTPEAIAGKYPQFELTKAFEEGKFEDEGWRVKKDGTMFWANAIITPIFNDQNEHIGFTKITRDLSERVRNEGLMKKNIELHQVNTDLDNFIYTASHDLRSPIANLEGLLTLMRQKISAKLDEPEKKIVQMMDKSILKLNNTIENLVEVTRAQKNLEDKLEVIPIATIISDVKEEIASQIKETSAEIEEDFKIENITFAKASLRSIVYNLLSNAMKYRSPKRKPKIVISTYKEDGRVILSVKDNGLGLTKSQVEKLFSMFKRFHDHVEGSGIGLYIVKRTMENYGGKVEVDSEHNKGTTFKLIFDSSSVPQR